VNIHAKRLGDYPSNALGCARSGPPNTTPALRQKTVTAVIGKKSLFPFGRLAPQSIWQIELIYRSRDLR
jgi:hypothetical protein